jgi:hypothetical protein
VHVKRQGICLGEVTESMRRGDIVPGVRSAPTEGYNVLHCCSHSVRAPQVPVDRLLAEPARPGMQVEQDKVVNLVSLCIYRTSLWRVVSYWPLTPISWHSCNTKNIISLMSHCLPRDIKLFSNLVSFLLCRDFNPDSEPCMIRD